MERSPCWSRLYLARPVAHGGSTLEFSVPEGLYPVERTHAGAVLEELQPMGRTHVGEGREGSYLWEEPHDGEEHEEEGAAEMKCYELTTTPFSLSLCPACGEEEVEELGVKLSLGRREGWGEGVFSFFLISYCPILLLIGNKLH